MRQLLSERARASERGQALVETALIITLILFIGLATFDLGRGIAAHIALTEATQEGALYAGYLLYDPDETVDMTDVQARVRESSTTEEVENAVVTQVGGCAEPPDFITIRSTYNLPVFSPLAHLAFGPTFALSVEIDATNLAGECP